MNEPINGIILIKENPAERKSPLNKLIIIANPSIAIPAPGINPKISNNVVPISKTLVIKPVSLFQSKYSAKSLNLNSTNRRFPKKRI